MRVIAAVVAVTIMFAGCLSIEDNACDYTTGPGTPFTMPPLPEGYIHGGENDAQLPLLASTIDNSTTEIEIFAEENSGIAGTVRGIGGSWWQTSFGGPANSGGQMEGGTTYELTAFCGPLGPSFTTADETERGMEASPGQGVLVYTAGFLDDGTMFYTNIEEIDQSSWPRHAEYEWSSGEPLQVYIYDETSDEGVPLWYTPSVGTPAGPVGAPNSWFPTIKGFNDGLKGIATTDIVTVRMAPEDAYTRPGLEDFFLYGEALTFVIKTVGVADVPCPDAVEVPDCIQS